MDQGATHNVELPAEVYDQLLDGPVAFLNLGLFERRVAEGDWVRLGCEDGRDVVTRVTGLAAAVEMVQGRR